MVGWLADATKNHVSFLSNLPPQPDSEEIGPDHPAPKIGDTVTRLGTDWVVEAVNERILNREGQEPLTEYLVNLRRADAANSESENETIPEEDA
jgi:hypothetical protein